jgi:hypothetical protein
VNTRCVDEEDFFVPRWSLRSLGLIGGSWVKKGSFAAESADPGFSFHLGLYLSRR